MLQGLTAHFLVNSTHNVQPGDSVLIHAAAGGVGQQLVQLISARGARVIAAVGTAEKQAKAASLGAHTVLRYDEIDDPDSFAAAVRAANGGSGVTVVYDGVGKDTFDASLGSLEPRGLLVLENPHQTQMGAPAGYMATTAGLEIYKALGAAQNVSYHSDVSDTAHCSIPSRRHSTR